MSWQRRLASRATLALLVYSLGATPAPAQAVQWRPDYGTARREASEKKQPLVLILSAGYCPACNQLESTTLRSPDVVRELNQRFIPLKVAADDPRNDYLVTGLRIQGLPAIVLISPGGQVLKAQEGYLDAAGFVALLKVAIAGADGPGRRSPQGAAMAARAPDGARGFRIGTRSTRRVTSWRPAGASRSGRGTSGPVAI
jgi:thioredoxin-related protein